MIKIKKIGVLSAGYVAAIFSFILAILQVLMQKLQVSIPSRASQIDSSLLAIFQGKGFWLMLIVAPLLGLIVGFIAGVIVAAIYNRIVVPICGGIKIELSEHK